jgi:hypothetical protein
LDVSGAELDRNVPHKTGDVFKENVMPHLKATTASSSINTDHILIPMGG